MMYDGWRLGNTDAERAIMWRHKLRMNDLVLTLSRTSKVGYRFDDSTAHNQSICYYMAWCVFVRDRRKWIEVRTICACAYLVQSIKVTCLRFGKLLSHFPQRAHRNRYVTCRTHTHTTYECTHIVILYIGYLRIYLHIHRGANACMEGWLCKGLKDMRKQHAIAHTHTHKRSQMAYLRPHRMSKCISMKYIFIKITSGTFVCKT